MKKQSYNFTVIEMLIIVTIFCLIIGILLPALNQTVDKAKLKSCRNNLRRIGQSVHWYSSDNLGHIPNIQQGMEEHSIPLLRLSDNLTVALGRLIDCYKENTYIFGCPDSPGVRGYDVACAWQKATVVWSAYLYRGKCNGLQDILHAPDNFQKPYVMDFACTAEQGKQFTPHKFLAVNMLYNDCHVEYRRNSPEPYKLFTVQSSLDDKIVPDCTKLWQNADRQRKNR